MSKFSFFNKSIFIEFEGIGIVQTPVVWCSSDPTQFSNQQCCSEILIVVDWSIVGMGWRCWTAKDLDCCTLCLSALQISSVMTTQGILTKTVAHTFFTVYAAITVRKIKDSTGF